MFVGNTDINSGALADLQHCKQGNQRDSTIAENVTAAAFPGIYIRTHTHKLGNSN